MRYPCKMKQLDNKYLSHSNRGMSLESDINVTNEYYLNNNIAIIYIKKSVTTSLFTLLVNASGFTIFSFFDLPKYNIAIST